MMQRLQPSIDRDRAALDTKLANQGITNGSSAYNNDQGVFQQGVNDQRIAALLAGDQEQQNDFNRGLARRSSGTGSKSSDARS
jgi:SOS response regulatory protein OraA/RecX